MKNYLLQVTRDLRVLPSLLLFLGLCGFTLIQAQDAPPIYLEIEVELPTHEAAEVLHDADLDIDHFHPKVGTNTLVLPASELGKLAATGFNYSIVTYDLANAIEQRNLDDLSKYDPTASDQAKTTAGFELGSMGGFYTFAEIVAQLDEMASLYPGLITPKVSIGTTAEGRTIWSVKISDNPATDESATEAQVYFDALHHAREPASGATVINFMFYLLENYGTDPDITYLVNNREIHIVPCVNPDGYEYNRQTNPNGGGFWRKNRRVNSGSSCRGVDLNRNYDSDFGGQGTSSNPCSDSYRGTSAFSEPESQAVRDFVNNIQPPIAYTTHTSGGYWLGPDFSNGQQEFAIHAELNSDCMDENEYIYGDANLILGYVAGTTQNWMYETNGTLTWTPEIGTTGFWPTIPEIIPLVNQQIKPYEYACWVAGALADFQGFSVLNGSGLSIGQNLQMNVEVKNKGLSKAAQNVQVTITSDNAGVTPVVGTVTYGNIASRTEQTNGTAFEFSVGTGVAVGTDVKFYVDVSQEGVVSDRDSFYLTVGDRSVLFSDNAESGTSNWAQSGSGTTWQTSDEDDYTGNNCFVDSRISHTAFNNNRAFAMNSSVSLAGASNPRLEFAAKWGLYQTGDYVRLQVSTNGGSSWSNVSTDAMETIGGGPGFKENERWTHQSVDLNSFIGQSVRFRFLSVQNNSQRSDGFYFDDFHIADYSDPPVCSINGSITTEICDGMGTVSTADDTYTITVTANLSNGSGAYDVLADGVEVAANISSGSSTNFNLPASGTTVGVSFRDAVDHACISGTVTSGLLSTCSPPPPTCSVSGSINSEVCDGMGTVSTTDDSYNITVSASVTNGSGAYDVLVDGTEVAANINSGTSTVLSLAATGSSVSIVFRDATDDGCTSSAINSSVLSSCSPTCSDGIQNGNETGVDCGGPDCAACPTCSDGIQNGNETGVDCGGPDCAACPTCNDGIQNGNETGVDCGGPDCAACPTCNDGIQNGNETGVDCGGPDCAACPTCNDGIQNGNETGVDCGGPDCAACPTCNDGIQNGNETGVDCGGPDCAACPTCNDGIQNGNETGVDCGGPDCAACPTAGLQIENGVVSGVGESWVSVPLQNSYSSMVVVTTVSLPASEPAPVVTRIRNASGNSFELRIQTTTTSTSSTYDIHYVVVEEGVYTQAADGVQMEAVKANSILTAENNNWVFESRAYQQAYSSPVVVGQVMTYNDTDWSVFWASANNSRTTPPSASSFAAGKNVGEDPDNTRVDETIGYIVIEAGSGSITNLEYAAGLGADNVFGVGNTSTGYTYGLTGLSGASSAVLSAAAMDGNNGGWPVLYGGNPFNSSQLIMAFDEDVANDTERSHTSEQVAYIAFGASSGPPTCNDGIQNGNETGVDCGGPDCAACPTCSDGIQNGSETGIDCGGPDCAACPTCSDGIQNGNETGVDCGGPDCAACPTCNDGIQNGNETGVDCGGPDCAACPTCNDGIQNGNETGVDCGGPDCAACPTCNDGIQNGNETGVDCGGPDCAACPTCNDGIQNGNETGVDCGGPDCAACPTCSDGIQNGNETGVDCGGPDCAACPTCSDGIQNGNETGVDCGGPDCAACPSTCSDGIQNGNETGVDCGGPDCAACPTCSDGIQNGNETGVDCGGPDCAACPTCSDGIQNGNETGVDCGGPDCAACPTCSDGIQNGNETGVDCGGPDCAACPVNYCASSSSNTNFEFIQTVVFNGVTNNSGNNGGYADFTGSVNFAATLGATENISLTPGFPSTSYNEFWTVYIDYNVDGDFTDAGELVYQSAGSTTQNGTITIPTGAALGTTRMRVQMQWNAYNSSSCQNFTYGEVEDYSITLTAASRRAVDDEGDLSLLDHANIRPSWTLFPNPAQESINLSIANEASWSDEMLISIVTAEGRVVQQFHPGILINDGQIDIDLSQLKEGMYFLLIQSPDYQESLRFIRKP